MTIGNTCWWITRPFVISISFLLNESILIILEFGFPLDVLLIFQEHSSFRWPLTLQSRVLQIRAFLIQLDFSICKWNFTRFWIITHSEGNRWIMVLVKLWLWGTIHATGGIGLHDRLIRRFAIFKDSRSCSFWVEQIWMCMLFVVVLVCEIVLQHCWLHGHLTTLKTVSLNL